MLRKIGRSGCRARASAPGPPGVPGNRVVGVLPEVRAGFVDQAVRVFGRLTHRLLQVEMIDRLEIILGRVRVCVRSTWYPVSSNSVASNEYSELVKKSKTHCVGRSALANGV